ncbi:hypothetical protein [Agromyces sp. ZXT2-6]|uniref:hypothetical protein n=1 Tax=Agromyces sp. ZXT2-6 TaxID=3461153 RepID=UPI004054E1CF
MTTAGSADARLGDDLATRALAVDGVDRVFPPTVRAAAARAAQLVAPPGAGGSEPPSRVDVGDHDGTLVVTARIATRREGDTPRTARRVADALIDGLPAGRDAAVRIRIAQIR